MTVEEFVDRMIENHKRRECERLGIPRDTYDKMMGYISGRCLGESSVEPPTDGK